MYFATPAYVQYWLQGEHDGAAGAAEGGDEEGGAGSLHHPTGRGVQTRQQPDHYNIAVKGTESKEIFYFILHFTSKKLYFVILYCLPIQSSHLLKKRFSKTLQFAKIF